MRPSACLYMYMYRCRHHCVYALFIVVGGADKCTRTRAHAPQSICLPTNIHLTLLAGSHARVCVAATHGDLTTKHIYPSKDSNHSCLLIFLMACGVNIDRASSNALTTINTWRRRSYLEVGVYREEVRRDGATNNTNAAVSNTPTSAPCTERSRKLKCSRCSSRSISLIWSRSSFVRSLPPPLHR